MIDGTEIEAGSGNAFADLELPDAERLKIKVRPTDGPIGHLTLAIA